MPSIGQNSLSGGALIVDNLSLRRAGLFAVLEPWARSNALMLGSYHFEKLWRLKPDAVRIAIISLGNSHVREPECLEMLQSAQQALGAARIAVIAESSELSDLVAAFETGVHGYIPTSTEPAIALQALSFILVGGSYFPPSVALSNGFHRTNVQADHSHQNCPRDGARTSWLTPMQLRVVELVSVGKSNKMIARDLNVCEATVKAHLRLLMKKLGLSSRTQVALYFTKAARPRTPVARWSNGGAGHPLDDPEVEAPMRACEPGACQLSMRPRLTHRYVARVGRAFQATRPIGVVPDASTSTQ